MAALEGRAFVASATPTPELAKSPEEVDDEQEGKALSLNIFVVNPVWEWDYACCIVVVFKVLWSLGACALVVNHEAAFQIHLQGPVFPFL